MAERGCPWARVGERLAGRICGVEGRGALDRLVALVSAGVEGDPEPWADGQDGHGHGHVRRGCPAQPRGTRPARSPPRALSNPTQTLPAPPRPTPPGRVRRVRAPGMSGSALAGVIASASMLTVISCSELRTCTGSRVRWRRAESATPPVASARRRLEEATTDGGAPGARLIRSCAGSGHHPGGSKSLTGEPRCERGSRWGSVGPGARALRARSAAELPGAAWR